MPFVKAEERKYGPAIAESVCPNCGAMSVVSSDRKRCPVCRLLRDQKEVDLIIEEDEDASYKTHNRFRWACQECGKTGLKWLKKGKRSINNCPNCGASCYRVRKTKVPPPGRLSSSSVWGPNIDKRRTRAKNVYKRKQCDSCGFTNRYLVKMPEKCKRCKSELSEEAIPPPEAIDPPADYEPEASLHPPGYYTGDPEPPEYLEPPEYYEYADDLDEEDIPF
jgi:hypothetical protein